MKKTFIRTLAAISIVAMTLVFASCDEKEENPGDNSTVNPTENQNIKVETPRSVTLGKDGNLYVTCYYPRCVARFDLSQKKFTTICKLGNYNPEGIAEVNGRLYIASGYIIDENNNTHFDNKLYVVDINSFKLIDSVTVGINPSSVKKLDNNHIVYNTMGDYGSDQGGLWIMDVNSKEITKIDVTLYNFDVYNGDIYGYTSIYSSEPLGFYKVDGSSHQTTTLDINWTASDNPYGIAVNPDNENIIVTTDGNYTATGDCYVFNSNGSLRKGGIHVGNLPSKIVPLSDEILLVLNEGGWGANNAGVSMVDIAAGTADNNFFDNANGRGLGDVAQDIIVDATNAYITVSFSNSLEIMDIYSGKSTRYATTK